MPDQWPFITTSLSLINSQLSQQSDLMVGSLQQKLDQEAQSNSLSGRGSRRRLRGWGRTPGGDQLPVRTDLNWSHFIYNESNILLRIVAFPLAFTANLAERILLRVCPNVYILLRRFHPMEKRRNEPVTCKMWSDGAPPSPTALKQETKLFFPKWRWMNYLK